MRVQDCSGVFKPGKLEMEQAFIRRFQICRMGRIPRLIDDENVLGSEKAVRCVKRISNANIFEAAISRDQAQSKLVDELLKLLGGSTKPVMARLVESGKLTLDDIKEAEEALRKLPRKDKPK